MTYGNLPLTIPAHPVHLTSLHEAAVQGWTSNCSIDNHGCASAFMEDGRFGIKDNT